MIYKIIVVVFFGVWALMIGRLYQISVKSNFYYEKLAKENVERKEYIKPIRGSIVDAHGNLLAINKIGFSLSIEPHLDRIKGELNKTIKLLKTVFPDINTTMMQNVYLNRSSPYNYKYIKVIEFISYDDIIKIYPSLSMNPHIKIDAETKRYYPYGQYVAHIVGYIGKPNKKENANDKTTKFITKVGKSGLERYYNKFLQGELGYIITKVDAKNKILGVLEKRDPVSNRDLMLNLDIKLQKYIYYLLRKKAAVAIVMKTTGEVVAAVSNPSYDPNFFVDGISVKNWKALQNNLGHPFRNKFINALYPPASVIKMGVALAASEYGSGVLDKDENCTGFITIGKSKHKFRCWSRWGHGEVDLKKSITESCDVYYYNKSLEIGIDNIAKTLRKIGLGVKTGIDLPLEYSGIIPDKAWKKKRYGLPWYMGETVISAIGQGYDNVTPMQIARYTAFLATGKLVTPRIVKKMGNKTIKIPSKVINFNKSHIKQIREGMYEVCNVKSGTAYKTMSNLPIKVAGKTGTAQVVSIPQYIKERIKEKDMVYFKRSHAWFTTYAPYKKPKYVVTVMIEHGGHGGSAAGPIVADIYRWLYQNGYIKEHSVEKFQADMNATDQSINSTQINL